MVPNVPANRALLTVAIVVLTVTSGCNGLLGDDVTTAQIGDRIQEKYDDVESYEATIETRVSGPDTNRTLVRAVVARPGTGNQRAEFVAPPEQRGNLVVSNTTTTWTYNASDNTASRMNTSGVDAMGQVNYTRLVEQYRERYDVSLDGSTTVADRPVYKLELTPKDDGEQFAQNATLWIDEDRWFPVKTRMSYTFDDETRTITSTYRNLSFNTGVDNDTFRFDPPEDATVERMDVPDVVQYDTRADVVENASVAVPEPTVPEGYELEHATLSENEGNTTVSLGYANGSDGLSVTKRTGGPASHADAENTTRVGDATASVNEFGERTSLSWHCGGASYSVSGPLSEDGLESIGESIACTGDDA